MAKFRFNLETLLEQRRRVEDAKRAEVAQVERERLALEDEIRAAQRALAEQKADLRAALAPGAGAVDVAGVRLQSHSSLHSAAAIQRLAVRLGGVLQKLERARASLLRATADRKAVELLRQRRFEEWRREENKKEAAAVDDMVNARVARRDAGSDWSAA